LNHFEAQVYQKDKILGFKIKTKLLAQCRVWKQEYQTRKLKRRLMEAEHNDLWADMEIDSSRFIQKIGSTMMLNSSVLLTYGLFLPWFYIGPLPLSLFMASSLNSFTQGSLSATFFLGGGIILFFSLRSLIAKKFAWPPYSIFSVLILLNVIVSYFMNKSFLNDAVKNMPVTAGPGVWVSGVAALLIMLSGLLTYLTRKKDKKTKNKEMYNREKRRRRKR
jgi:multidrug transporter EmrE-like cation transporter